jgi:hypothetical protein
MEKNIRSKLFAMFKQEITLLYEDICGTEREDMNLIIDEIINKAITIINEGKP